MTIVWVSRHAMTDEQAAGLRAMYPHLAHAEIESRNVTWEASADADKDQAANVLDWQRLYNAAGRRGVIAGVFPPVAMEARRRGKRIGIRVVSPVSRQAPELRVGDGPIPFEHVRWAILG